MEHVLPSTILLVEDKLDWQNILMLLCEKAGYDVIQAFDANSARHQSLRWQSSLILALVDLELLAPGDGLPILDDFRDQSLYTIVVSGKIEDAHQELEGRPEIIDLVDKRHFEAQGYTTEVFLPKLQDAVAYAIAARWADGQLPEQQERLWQLPDFESDAS